MVSVWLFTDFMYCYRVNSVHSFIHLLVYSFLPPLEFIYLFICPVLIYITFIL